MLGPRSAGRDELDEDLAAFGIEPASVPDAPEPEACGLLPENVDTVSAFLAVQTQMTRSGFRYADVRAGLRLAGVRCTPELFAGLRTMEAAAVEALAELDRG